MYKYFKAQGSKKKTGRPSTVRKDRAAVTGALLALILADRTQQSFCLFASPFSKQVKQHDRNTLVLLIADRAAAHQKEVCLNRGIVLQHLPTACR